MPHVVRKIFFCGIEDGEDDVPEGEAADGEDPSKEGNPGFVVKFYETNLFVSGLGLKWCGFAEDKLTVASC